MRRVPSLSIESLVVPGMGAQDAERLAADLHGHLAALEDADRANGVVWQQPQGPVDLTLEGEPDGTVDAASMARAIRSYFIVVERPS